MIGKKHGFATRSDKGAQPEIEQAHGVAVTGRKIHMALFGTALVQGPFGDQAARPVAPRTPRKGAFSMVRQQERFSDAPVAGNRQVRHGLTQLGSIARVLDEVHLVDDVHEVVQLGHAPENAVESQPKLPEILAPVSMCQQVGLAQVCMRALRIGAVVSIERGQGEAGPLRDLAVQSRLDYQPSGA